MDLKPGQTESLLETQTMGNLEIRLQSEGTKNFLIGKIPHLIVQLNLENHTCMRR